MKTYFGGQINRPYQCTGILHVSCNAAGNDWMSSLNSDLFLSQFSIPGSHNSMALFEPFSRTAKTQNLSLSDQLKAGVRFVDIRCRHLDNGFVIHHGSVYQRTNFDDVLNAVTSFLNANPSESIMMSVKEEHTPSGNTRSFAQTFDSYVAKNPSKWHLGSAIPTASLPHKKTRPSLREGLRAAGGSICWLFFIFSARP